MAGRHELTGSPLTTPSVGTATQEGAEKPTILLQGNLPMEERDNEPHPVVLSVCQRGMKENVYTAPDGDKSQAPNQKSSCLGTFPSSRRPRWPVGGKILILGSIKSGM